MASRGLTCIVCEDAMNRNTRQPVSLPCGHTFCRQCLIRIHDNERLLRCPTCRQCHQGRRPQDLPPNFALLSMVDPDEADSRENNSTIEVPSPADSDNISQPEGNPVCASSGENNPGNGNGNRRKNILKGVGIAAGAIAGGAAVVAAAPLVLTAAGFTSAGIAAGSWAASMMSAAAVANGGGVAAGSLVAVLQSAGAAGIGAAATAGLGAGGAAAGTGIGFGISKFFGRPRNENGDTNESAGNNDDGGNDGGPSGGSGKRGSSQSNSSQEGKDDRGKNNEYDKEEDEKDDASEKSDDDDDEKEESSDTEDSGYGRNRDVAVVPERTTEQSDREGERSEPLVATNVDHANVPQCNLEEEDFLNARKLCGDAMQRNLIDFADEE